MYIRYSTITGYYNYQCGFHCSIRDKTSSIQTTIQVLGVPRTKTRCERLRLCCKRFSTPLNSKRNSPALSLTAADKELQVVICIREGTYVISFLKNDVEYENNN